MNVRLQMKTKSWSDFGKITWKKKGKSNKCRVEKKSNNLRPNVIYAFTVFKHIFINKCQLQPSYNFALLLDSCKSSVPYSLLAIGIGFWEKNDGIFKKCLLVKAGACPVCYYSLYLLKIHNKLSPQSKLLFHAISTWDLWKFKTAILSSLNIILTFLCNFTLNSEHNVPAPSAMSQGPNGFSISFWHLQAIWNQWCCVLRCGAHKGCSVFCTWLLTGLWQWHWCCGGRHMQIGN